MRSRSALAHLCAGAFVVGSLAVAGGSAVHAVPIEDRSPQLLADLSTNRDTGVRSGVFVTADHLYVTVDTAPNSSDSLIQPAELWQIDRVTEQQTRLVGADEGYSYLDAVWSTGAGVLLVAEGSSEQPQLLLLDEQTGALTLLYEFDGPDGFPREFFELTGVVYFAAGDSTFGRELWVTDLTPSGTTPVADVNPGTGGFDPSGAVTVPVAGGGEAAFLRGRTNAAGTELFRFDPPSTFTVYDLGLASASSSPSFLSVTDEGALYFRANAGGGNSSWRIAAASADPALDTPELVSAGVTGLVVDGNAVWEAQVGAGIGLYRTADLASARELVVPDARPRSMTPLGGRVVYSQVETDGESIWVSDGTPAGTALEATVQQVWSPFVGSGIGGPALGAVVDAAGVEPWITAGTPGSTQRLADIYPGAPSSNAASIVAVDGGWYFTADDGVRAQQVWFTDGTTAGTRRLSDLGPPTTASSFPDDFAAAGSVTVFSARTEVHGEELWRHDPLTGEVALVADLTPGPESSNPRRPTRFDDRVVFQAEVEPYGREAWITDGTASGTTLLADSVPGSAGNPYGFTVVGDDLLYISNGQVWVVRSGATVATSLGLPFAASDILGEYQGLAVVYDEMVDRLVLVDPATGSTTPLIDDVQRAETATVDGVLFVSVEAVGGGGGGEESFAPTEQFQTFRIASPTATPVVLPAFNGVDIYELIAGSGEVVAAVEGSSGDDEEISLHSLGSEDAWYSIATDGTVTPVVVPVGDPITSVEFDSFDGPGAPVVFDDGLVFTIARGEAGGGGGSRLAGATGDPVGQLVSIDDGVMTTLESVPDRAISIVGVHAGQLYVQTAPFEEGKGGGIRRPSALTTPTGPALLRTSGPANSAEVVVDFVAQGFDARERMVLTNEVIYGSGSFGDSGVEPIGFDLGPVPDAPTGVNGVAGDRRATVSWTAPADDGGGPVVGYTVTASPGGATCTTTGATSCAVTGLANGTSYTFTVVASTASRRSEPSSASAPVTPVAPTPVPSSPDAEIISLTPGRVLDTRPGQSTVDGDFEGTGRIAADDFIEVDIVGRAGVPATGVDAVVMNMTAINPSGRGFLTVFSCGPRPVASGLNFGAAGAVVGNEVVAQLSASGSVCVYTSTETDLTIDVVGAVPSGSPVVSLDPARLFESRPGLDTVDGQFEGGGNVGPDDFVEIDIIGRGGVASSGVSSVIMNVTAINPSGRGFITAYACGDRPLASSLNFGAAGVVVGNEIIAKLSDAGTVCIYSSASTGLTVDVVGYVPDGSTTVSLDPARLLETRTGPGLETIDGQFEGEGRVAAAEVIEVQIAGRGGVPATDVGAAVMNVTAINPDGRGFLTMFPCGDQPVASSLNFGAAGVVVGNEVIAKLSSTGTVCVFVSAGTDLTIDVVGHLPA
jgi:ELWxxDGT repeat protein